MIRNPGMEAEENIDGLRNDLPDIDKLMYTVSGILLKNSAGLDTREIIFRSLMTGATLASAEYRKSDKSTGEIINKIMEK